MCRQLPFVSGNNSSYEASIASTGGWAVGNGALSVEPGCMRFTKTTATSAKPSFTADKDGFYRVGLHPEHAAAAPPDPNQTA
mgnify:CR=1 FL=1